MYGFFKDQGSMVVGLLTFVARFLVYRA
jgi:hypothetical protein